MESGDDRDAFVVGEDTQPGKLSFKWVLRQDKVLPAKYSLVVGLKHSGAILAKSLGGIGHFHFGSVEYARGGAFAKAFLSQDGHLVSLAAEDELPYDRNALCDVLKTELFTNADKVLIIESLPAAIVKKLGGGANIDEERNHFFEFRSTAEVQIQDTLGFELLRTAEEVSVQSGTTPSANLLYIQHITSETSTTFPDVQEAANKLQSLPQVSATWKLTVNETRLKSALKYALQALPYT